MIYKVFLLVLLAFSLSANANFIEVKGKYKDSKSKASHSYQQSSTTKTKNAVGGNQFSCGKRTCGQMTSCAEAKYHLNQCGVRKLDRDGDGVPCESLCGS